jgi:hypothetical protein
LSGRSVVSQGRVAVKLERKPGQPMPDTLVIFAIFVALSLLAIWVPKITHFTLITLVASAACAAAGFLWLGAGMHFREVRSKTSA